MKYFNWKQTLLLIPLLSTVACEQQETEVEILSLTQDAATELKVPLPKESKTEPAIDRLPGGSLPTISSALEPEGSPYREIIWDDLMPEEYRPEIVLKKYMEQLSELEDDDPKAIALYGQIQAELDNAPLNEKLNGKKIKLPGFIAPLENTDGKVSEFLLVPYYGACIHVPPPPVNQTVLIKTMQDSTIAVDNMYDPIWVKGEIQTQGEKTDIGEAGYRIVNAEVEVYSE
mgnify:FL=1